MFTKKKSSKSDVKNVVTIDVFSHKNYIFAEDEFKPLDKLTYNTSNFITSYVSNKDLISTKVEISRSIPDEDIPDMIDIKAYEELGLDQANSYVISSYEVANAGEEREFYIFVAEPERLEELFLPVKKETKYIDLIIPEPLLYKPLYTKEILQDNSTHCFVYFTEHDASVTLYKDGEYLYSKSIEYSLEQIYNKYCEFVGEKVDEKEFYTILESEGLKTVQTEYQQNFMKIFGEVFITINDIIIYAKRAFELDNIDHVFVGSQKGPIIGLDDYSQNYLGLNSSDFNFNYNITNNEWYTDQFQSLMLLSAFEYMEHTLDVVNLSMYPRAPAFIYRPSGQFIISVFTAISLSLAYPLYYLIGSYISDAEIFALNEKNKTLTKEAKKYKEILGKKRANIKLLDENIEALRNTYDTKAKTLTSIYDKKVNYRLKSGLFHMLAKELHKFDVHINELYTEDDILYISMVSPDDKKLTEFIKYISQTHFDDIKEIDIERIEKDPSKNYYKGLLKVVR